MRAGVPFATVGDRFAIDAVAELELVSVGDTRRVTVRALGVEKGEIPGVWVTAELDWQTDSRAVTRLELGQTPFGQAVQIALLGTRAARIP